MGGIDLKGVLNKLPNLPHPHPFVEAIRVGVFAINAEANSLLSSAIELAENVLQERCADTSTPPCLGHGEVAHPAVEFVVDTQSRANKFVPLSNKQEPEIGAKTFGFQHAFTPVFKARRNIARPAKRLHDELVDAAVVLARHKQPQATPVRPGRHRGRLLKVDLHTEVVFVDAIASREKNLLFGLGYAGHDDTERGAGSWRQSLPRALLTAG